MSSLSGDDHWSPYLKVTVHYNKKLYSNFIYEGQFSSSDLYEFFNEAKAVGSHALNTRLLKNLLGGTG